MSKELVVSTTTHETRVAILEDDKLTEIYVEQDDQHAVAGSIYKGRVSRVLPGMQSAFVQIGLERDAFLYVSDFFEESEEIEVAVTDAAPAGSDDGEGRSSRRRGTRRDRRGRRRGRRRSRSDEDQGQPDRETGRADDDRDSREPAASSAGERRARDDRDDRDDAQPRSRSRSRRRGGRGRSTRDAGQDERPRGREAAGGDRDRSPQRRDAADEEDGRSSRRETRDEESERPRRRERREAVSETRAPRRERSSGFAVLPGESLAKYRGPEPEEDSADEPEYEQQSSLAEELIEATGQTDDRGEEPRDGEGGYGFDASEESGAESTDDSESDEDASLGDELLAATGGIEPVKPGEPDPAPVAVGESSSPAKAEEAKEEKEGEDDGDRRGLSWWRGPFRRYRRPLSRLREAQSSPEPEPERPPERTYEPEPEPVVESGPEPDNELTALAAEVVGEAQARLEAAKAAPKQASEPEHSTPGMPVPEDEADDDDDRDGREASVRAPRGDGEYVRRGRRGRRRGGRGRRPSEAEDTNESPRESSRESSREVQAAAPAADAEGGEREESRGSRGGDRRRSERSRGGSDTQRNGKTSISDLLSPGQEILVQVSKEPLGKKGARITSHIALPGRYLVYMPTVEHIGVSRKIGTDAERQRLRRTVQDHRDAEGMSGGFILRTAGEGAPQDEIRADMSFLHNLWLDIKRKGDRRRAPSLVHHDLDVVERVLRDFVGSDFKTIWVDNEDQYEHIVHFIERFQPSMLNQVKLYVRDEPIFDAFNITAELEKALRPKVWLKSGGYIVINQTEALVAIDVNTGKFVGRSDLEDTIVRTNVEAVKEIVRQIRLRDLGGIIVLDFIDMEDRKNRSRVHQALQQELAKDHAPSKALQFNDFGLISVTRKRVKQSLERALCEPCPYCDGAGYVKSVKTVIFEILAECGKIYDEFREQRDVSLRVSPDVAKVLKEKSNSYLAEIEEALDKNVLVRSDTGLHREHFDMN